MFHQTHLSSAVSGLSVCQTAPHKERFPHVPAALYRDVAIEQALCVLEYVSVEFLGL